MLKDIPFKKVDEVKVALTSEKDTYGNEIFIAYVLNYLDKPIHDVFIRSRAYGEINGETKKTSTLRHFFELIPPKSYAQIEPIQDKVLYLENEFWISFRLGKDLIDKKCIFPEKSLIDDELTYINLLDKTGVFAE